VRSGKVVCIAGHAATGDLRVDAGAASFCMFVFFKYQGTSTLAHNKPIAVGIKWPGCLFRVVIACRQRFHGSEPAYTRLVDGRLGATGNDDISLAPLNVVHGVDDGG